MALVFAIMLGHVAVTLRPEDAIYDKSVKTMRGPGKKMVASLAKALESTDMQKKFETILWALKHYPDRLAEARHQVDTNRKQRVKKEAKLVYVMWVGLDLVGLGCDWEWGGVPCG